MRMEKVRKNIKISVQKKNKVQDTHIPKMNSFQKSKSQTILRQIPEKNGKGEKKYQHYFSGKKTKSKTHIYQTTNSIQKFKSQTKYPFITPYTPNFYYKQEIQDTIHESNLKKKILKHISRKHIMVALPAPSETGVHYKLQTKHTQPGPAP